MPTSRQARNPQHVVHGYQSLSQAVILLRPLKILTLTMPSYDHFLHLQSLKLGVGKADLKIAAIGTSEEFRDLHVSIGPLRGRRSRRRVGKSSLPFEQPG
jgi:hypothetical protein